MVVVLLTIATNMQIAETRPEELITSPKTEEQATQGQFEDTLTVQPYEKYGLIGKMRLSAAYFVNPKLADQTKIGYFVPIANLDDSERAKVEQLVQEGEGSISVEMSDGKFYKLLGQNLDLESELSSENVGVILDSKPGWETEGVPVVSWGGVRTASQDEVLGSPVIPNAPK
jgi:hypothetical protein